MKNFSVVCRDDDASKRVGSAVIKALKNNNLTFTQTQPEIVIVIGGDGTFLSAIQQYLPVLDRVCFVGIHTGTLGFFTDYTLGTLEQCIVDILSKQPMIEQKRMLKIRIGNNEYYALNEARVESTKTQAIEVYVGNEKLESFRGNGLCISTQSGSTGYNRSLRGAIVESGLELLQLTEIAGIHHTVYRSANVPIILSGNRYIHLFSEFNGATLSFDHYSFPLENVRDIEISLSDKKVNFAHFYQSSWFKRIEQLF
ncbi:MAG: NAD kinase [Erysipelotrichaceae bacterium]|nr:NAD kinase [Erysipelotrichaceae bacterium]